MQLDVRRGAARVGRLTLRRDYDLLLALLAACGVACAPWLPLALRVPLGLVAALFLPGYVLLAALAHPRALLDRPARLALSIGLSAATVIALTLALDTLGWGLRTETVSLALAAWLACWAAFAGVRRAVQPDVTADGARARQRPVLAVAAGLALALTLTGAWLAVRGQDATAQTTEFAVLSAAGSAEGYPARVLQDEPVPLRVSVVNREGRALGYRIEARSGGTLLTTLAAEQVADGGRWDAPLTLALPQAGANQAVEIVLFRADSPAPYRTLRLVIDVRGR